MDNDLLSIKLTAYVLDELDALQKVEIERILTQNTEARDQVLHIKSVAKRVRELLPQTSDDVEPMTPLEYRNRKGHGATENIAPLAAVYEKPVANAPLSNHVLWILVLLGCCVLLAMGWLWQANKSVEPMTSHPARPKVTAPVAHTEDAENLKKETAARIALEEQLKKIQTENEVLHTSLYATDAEKTRLKNKQTALEHRLVRLGIIQAMPHPSFVPTQAQVMYALPVSASNNTLELIKKSLKENALPAPNTVDVGELIQSFKYNYPAPPPEAKLPLLFVHATPCPWAHGHLLARVALSAGTQSCVLSSLQVEFNPSTVQSWRLIGREDGEVSGGQGCGEFKAGAALTLLYELTPAENALLPLQTKRSQIVAQMESAQRTTTTAHTQVEKDEAKLTLEDLRLDLQDLDTEIEAAKKQSVWRYSKAASPTTQAASGDLLAVSLSVTDASGKTSIAQATLGGKPLPFAQTDVDFHLAASAAALGLVLRESPLRGDANLNLVSTLVGDISQTNDQVKLINTLVQDTKTAQ